MRIDTRAFLIAGLVLTGNSAKAEQPATESASPDVEPGARAWAKSFENEFCDRKPPCYMERHDVDTGTQMLKNEREGSATRPMLEAQLKRDQQKLDACLPKERPYLQKRDKMLTEASCAQINALSSAAWDLEIVKSRKPDCGAKWQAEVDKANARVETLMADPKLMVPLLSAYVCTISDARSAILKEIATQKKYARVGGAVNLQTLYSLQTQLRSADEAIAHMKSWVVDFKKKPMACGHKDVKSITQCIDVEEFAEWLPDGNHEVDCTTGLGGMAFELGPLAIHPDE